MTRTQYEVAIRQYHPANRLIDQIPANINRAGKHYKKLVKQIYAKNTQRTRTI